MTDIGSNIPATGAVRTMTDIASNMPATTTPSISPMEYQLKKYLLLLATLVATVTYAAGLNPPGGSWLEDDKAAGELAGDSILRDTNYTRYIAFYCFNAISFAASLVVSLLLLLLHRDAAAGLLRFTRAVMVVDLLALMGAYAAGTSHDRFTTVCASVLVVATAVYVIFAVPRFSTKAGTEKPSPDDLEKHEILMVLAVFVATVAYVAGLNPPGGFWRTTLLGRHTAGDPVLQALHPIRYKFFFFSNTTAFIASLLAITFNVHYDKLRLKAIRVPLYGLVVVAILGIGGAYAAGSCRDSKHTIYVLGLVVAVLLCIFFQWRFVGSAFELPCYGTGPTTREGDGKAIDDDNDLDKIREFIQLLVILAATVAYQAGVDPPGGVWAENGDGYSAGDPILLTTHPGRFKVFFYFNSAAFVASLVIMVMLQNEFLVRRHALEAVMILDLFGLIGAYAAGSCRDTSTSIYMLAMAGGVLVYVVIHIVFFTLDPSSQKDNKQAGEEEKKKSEEEKKKSEEEKKKERLEKKREVLLLLAILAATLTYQAGLTPPGGLWENDRFGHRAGFPVLQDKYPRRYKAFLYCNTASFMASVALIVLLLNPNLYGPGIKCYALFVCMVAGMFSLIGAYAAGSSLHLRTSIVLMVLVLAVFAAVLYVAIIHRHRRRDDAKTKDSPAHQEQKSKKPSEAAASGSSAVTSKKPSEAAASGSSAVTSRNVAPAGSLHAGPAGAQPHTTVAGSYCTGSGYEAAAKDSSPAADHQEQKSNKAAAMYLMLVGILAASVTYLTGLKPPGGLWREDGGGHSAGNPVLYDINKHRYNAFFYSNSTSFMASVTVIVLLLPRMLRDKEEDRNKRPLWPMHTAMFLGMLALLGAYAAGSARDWCTSKNVILLLLPILGFVGLLFFWKKGKTAS